MSTRYCIFCLVVVSHVASVPLRPLILSTSSTYKPATLLLPPGFDSQKPPHQPMLYPYAVSSSGISSRPKLLHVTSTTPDWIPVALNVKSDLPYKANLYSTSQTMSSKPMPLLKERVWNDIAKQSSPSYKEGPVFESIVYGTWKPDPPLQPIPKLNGTRLQQYGGSSSNTGSKLGPNVAVEGKLYNKTINRQHGGFIGHIRKQQKPTKVDRQLLSSTTTLRSVELKSKELTEMSAAPKAQRNVKKQGRRKIRPLYTTIENSPIEKRWNREEVAINKEQQQQQQQNISKVNATNPKLMEVAKQATDTKEVKYGHKQTSTHSVEVMTSTDADEDDAYIDNDSDDDKYNFNSSRTQGVTNLSTEPQADYNDDEADDDDDDDDDDDVDDDDNINATRRSWPADFLEEPITTTEAIHQPLNLSNKFDYNNSLEADPSELPLALSALNIPPSLWPNLPGNITKLGKPYEAESSAEEPALCVPITVREQNVMNSKELVYIERVFCFPMPPSSSSSSSSSTTFENILNPLESSTTLKTVTTPKLQNFNDFVDTNTRIANVGNSFQNHFHLVASILVVYFKFLV